LPATAVGVAGTPGGPGTTALDAAEALDVPIVLVAVEVKV
jgi:L-cystine uptake protein TcyP (sodium:dicarboxylate symporter family)